MKFHIIMHLKDINVGIFEKKANMEAKQDEPVDYIVFADESQHNPIFIIHDKNHKILSTRKDIQSMIKFITEDYYKDKENV